MTLDKFEHIKDKNGKAFSKENPYLCDENLKY